ncbi:hypothetical protein SNK04_14570 [Fusarium graminearum]
MTNKLNTGNKTTHDSNSAKLETITQPRFLFFHYAHPNLPHDRQERMTLDPGTGPLSLFTATYHYQDLVEYKNKNKKLIDTKWESTYAQTPVLYAAEPRINGF